MWQTTLLDSARRATNRDPVDSPEEMMRLFLILSVVVALGLSVPAPLTAQAPDRMNPLIALHEQGLPAFGIAHPQIVARGGGRPRRGAEVRNTR